MGCGAPSVMLVPLIWISSGDSGPSAMAIIISSRFGSADPGGNMSPGCKATTTLVSCFFAAQSCSRQRSEPACQAYSAVEIPSESVGGRLQHHDRVVAQQLVVEGQAELVAVHGTAAQHRARPGDFLVRVCPTGPRSLVSVAAVGWRVAGTHRRFCVRLGPAVRRRSV